MFSLFKRKRKLKIAITLISVLIVSLFISPFIEVFKGTNLPIHNLLGEYKSSSGNYIIINDIYGRMVLENYGTDFKYTYEAGTFSCTSIENDDSWKMIALGSGDLINNFTKEYMYRLVENEENF